jgi:hypothetical protein
VSPTVHVLNIYSWCICGGLILEALETLGGGAYLEELGYWGHTFEGYNWSLVFSLLPVCNKVKDPPALSQASTAMIFCPQVHGTQRPWIKLSETLSQNKYFLIMLFSHRFLSIAMQQ